LQESSRSKHGQNLTCSGIIEFKDVFVPDKNKLAKADSFETGLSKCLMESRLTLTYITLGAMAGAYEAAYKYSMQRISFGKPIAGFQMTQQKLVRMLGEIEACLTLLVKTT